MTTEETLSKYVNIANSVFSWKNRSLPHQDGGFKSKTLQTMVERLVEERNLGIHMKPESTDGIRAYAFVCGSKEAQRGSSEGALREHGGAPSEHRGSRGEQRGSIWPKQALAREQSGEA